MRTVPAQLAGEVSTRIASHTYSGNDFPVDYPLDLDTISMTLHESVHFTANLSDINSNSAWLNLVHLKSRGHARLGPDHRVFTLTMFHQHHCLVMLHLGMADNNPVASSHHIQHCLDYLRQTFLCAAADGLEYGDFMERNFSKERVGDMLVCQDWEKVYMELDENVAEWEAWSSRWN
ncbi:hypothetical protein EVJ58_g7915 [Rhodofomes roseus]|uniref:Uncharacterized protein n=1 Tax=Rhodofomes roseus TaxID=34475 RepID=A0A4Y9Y218_9APHY|nr:hypothetical protein EVJ58_g7915 [Rhodofomes roseus]